MKALWHLLQQAWSRCFLRVSGSDVDSLWQDILETWRLRTPNEWESLGTWADVLTWRNAIYNVVINAFKNVGDMAPHLHQLGYRDKAWCAPALQHSILAPSPSSIPVTCELAIRVYYGLMDIQSTL